MSARVRKKLGSPARIELICVGTELLCGQLNTHQSRISVALRARGLQLARESSVADSVEEISGAISAALARSDALLICGGLGPTFDDLTRDGLAAALGRKLVFKPALWDEIRRKLARHGFKVPENNRRQAFVVEGAAALSNPFGSAPGQKLTLKTAWGPKMIFLMPGPGAEMWPIFEGHILPLLCKRFARGVFCESLSAHFSGIAESVADKRLAELTRRPTPGLSCTILAGSGQVDFHATALGPSRARARAEIERVRRVIGAELGAHLFGEGAVTLESAVGELLKSRKLTLAVAESCTGGMLGAKLTSVPGSSAYFLGGALVYSNESKTSLLGVDAGVLARDGAVSERCAAEMAERVRERAGADLGLSITGIAGPSGGTDEKPVGLVYLGLAGLSPEPEVVRKRFAGARETIRLRAVMAALDLLRSRLAHR